MTGAGIGDEKMSPSTKPDGGLMRRRFCGSLLLLCGFSLACAGVDATPQMPTSSPQAIATANQIGIPSVMPGAGIAGPFDGPEGTIYYLDRSGLVTFFAPQTYITYLGVAQTGEFKYMMAPQGFYAVQGQQVTQLQGPADEMMRWPQVDPLAGVTVQYLQNNPQLIQPAGGGAAMDYATASYVSRMQHETTMSILDNMGNANCTEHYEDHVYVGCW